MQMVLTCWSTSLDLLSQNRALAPANQLKRWKLIMTDDLKVPVGSFREFFGWMGFESEKNFEQRRHRRRPHWQMQKVASRRNHPGHLSEAFFQRHILQHAARHNQIKGLVCKRQGQDVALREANFLIVG